MPQRQPMIAVVMLLGIAGTSLLLIDRDAAPPAADQVVIAEVPKDLESDSLPMHGVPEPVVEFLRNGQFWRAARAMRSYLADGGETTREAVLVAARAEAGWGGWEQARTYLEGRPWLGEIAGGEGWYWLARALEEEDDLPGALRAYGEYLSAAPARRSSDRRIVAQLRRGLILLRQERREQGAELLQGLSEEAPELEPWVNLLAAEALAPTGDPARVRELAEGSDVPELRLRGRRAVISAYEGAGDHGRTRALALRYRGDSGAAAARAEFSLAAARAALSGGDTAAAFGDLRYAISEAEASQAARSAAELLERLPGLTAADRLSIAGVLDRHGAKTRAAAAYARWLASGAGTEAERRQVRLRRARALFAAGRYADAAGAAGDLESAAGRTGAEALLLLGRAEYRRGRAARARDVWLRLAERHPGTQAGSEGLFLIADLAHDDGEDSFAARIYRRVASEFPGTDRAGLSLMRLGGIRFLARDWGAAAAAWDEYHSRYPEGERWLEAAYWAGRAREAAGDTAGAASLYKAVRQREPLSYYALTSAERLGESFWPVPLGPDPAEDPESRGRVDRWMRSVDLLRAAGLHGEAEAEADRWIRTAGDDESLLYALAESLNERGLTLRGIRIGLRLQRETPRPGDRLLRIVYPFPYRSMIEAEAREKGLNPFLVAALTRQESLFKARITSHAGARGLMQIMPQTGAALARGARIGSWDPDLLYQPEINVHLGTRYLSEQMSRYDGSLPAVFSAYNAGPHRIDRWMKLPEWGDEQLFTERIPYRETRDYVKILTRNIAVYQGLYR